MKEERGERREERGARKQINEIRSLIKSFRYAFRGMLFCIKNERNMRIHLSLSAAVLCFGLVYRPQPTDWALLALSLGALITSEGFNTAIEVICNREASGYQEHIRLAKDIAAGAVLVSAIAVLGVLAAVFINARFLETLVIIARDPLLLCGGAALALLAVIFVFRRR